MPKTYTISVTRGFNRKPDTMTVPSGPMALDMYRSILDEAERIGDPAVLVLSAPDGSEIASDII